MVGAGVMAVLAMSLLAAAASGVAEARPPTDYSGFAGWRAAFKPKAAAVGISAATFERALGAIEPDLGVIDLLRRQPELHVAIWDYLDRTVSSERVTRGRDLLIRHQDLLAAIEDAHRVDRHVLVAIWGIESTYGDKKGTRNVVRSLATLGWAGGRRSVYGETQLLAALAILEAGDVVPEAMTGSWAGAMGHTQFVPTTYRAFAVDFDKDGRRDVWGTLGDALGSTAAYLKKSGWRFGEPWGYEVRLPAGYDYLQTGLGVIQPMPVWQGLGITRRDGLPFPDGLPEGSVLLPTGAKGPAFLVLPNFRALLHYNSNVTYGIAAGLLADRLEGLPEHPLAWPRHLRLLEVAERLELQRLLAARGFDVGVVDGVVGTQTRKAIMTFQRTIGMLPDGYASEEVLAALRTGHADGVSSARPEPAALER